jgi:hypothetical protein
MGLAACLAVSAMAQADGPRVLGEEDVKQLWAIKNAKVALPKYPTEAVRRHMTGCVAVAFRINADGSTSDHTVLRSHFVGGDKLLEQKFDDLAIKSAKTQRYGSTNLNKAKEPVYTYSHYAFSTTDDGAGEETTREASAKAAEPCKIEDFAGEVNTKAGTKGT